MARTATTDHAGTRRIRTSCCGPDGTLISQLRRRPALFRALGHPVRLEILGLLDAHGGELCACDIEAHFRLAQPTISHHLRLLKAGQLVSSERRGVWQHYRLQPGVSAGLRLLVRRAGGRPHAHDQERP